jgi:hypothetical protein
MNRLTRYDVSFGESLAASPSNGKGTRTGNRISDLIVFWSRQLSEHALFLSLGIEMLDVRRDALDQHRNWEKFRETKVARLKPLSDPGPVAEEALELSRVLRGLKTHIYDRLDGGEWLGWIFPSFVDHTRRELDYFVEAVTREQEGKKRSRKDTVSEELSSWLRFMREHAGFAAHLLDPEEKDLHRRAMAIEDELGRAEQLCAGGMEQLVTLSDKAGKILDSYFHSSGLGTRQTKSIVHPILAAHVVREGEEFLRTIKLLNEKKL